MVTLCHTFFSTSSIDNLPEMLSKLLDRKCTNPELCNLDIFRSQPRSNSIQCPKWMDKACGDIPPGRHICDNVLSSKLRNYME